MNVLLTDMSPGKRVPSALMNLLELLQEEEVTLAAAVCAGMEFIHSLLEVIYMRYNRLYLEKYSYHSH